MPSDHFTSVAANYAEYRPDYPPEVFEFIASLAPSRRVAWDCGTGSGQAAIELARRFESVIATDLSQAQIDHAQRHPRIAYRVAPAEASGLSDRSAELVNVSQALHWFDLHKFYDEVRRVLVPGGAFTVTAYGDLWLEDKRIDPFVQHYNFETVGPYWPAGRAIVTNLYRDLELPFPKIKTPEFKLQKQWSLDELLGYMRSWSATALYVLAKGADPAVELERAIAPLWGDRAATRVVRWPFAVGAARMG